MLSIDRTRRDIINFRLSRNALPEITNGHASRNGFAQTDAIRPEFFNANLTVDDVKDGVQS